MLRELLAWLNENQGALTAIAALMAAGTASGAWLCTIVLHWRTGAKLDTLHVQINSRMDQLIAAALQAGIIQGRSEQPKD
jgi:hypothetical protein